MTRSVCQWLLLSALSAALPSMAATVRCTDDVNQCGAALDGDWPAQGQEWTINTASWFGKSGRVKIDLGAVVMVTGLTVSVDNNDTYRFLASEDGETWTPMMTVRASEGEVGWGMDTVSSLKSSPEHVKRLKFTPGPARYLKVRAVSGDDMYSVGEVLVHTLP